MPTSSGGASTGATNLGWWSFAIVVIAVPFSAIFFTGAVILTQFCLTSAGIAAAKRAISPAVLTALVYTVTAVYIAPGFFPDAFTDSSGRHWVILFTLFNYGAFTIGLSLGIYKSYFRQT